MEKNKNTATAKTYEHTSYIGMGNGNFHTIFEGVPVWSTERNSFIKVDEDISSRITDTDVISTGALAIMAGVSSGNDSLDDVFELVERGKLYKLTIKLEPYEHNMDFNTITENIKKQFAELPNLTDLVSALTPLQYGALKAFLNYLQKESLTDMYASNKALYYSVIMPLKTVDNDLAVKKYVVNNILRNKKIVSEFLMLNTINDIDDNVFKMLSDLIIKNVLAKTGNDELYGELTRD